MQPTLYNFGLIPEPDLPLTPPFARPVNIEALRAAANWEIQQWTRGLEPENKYISCYFRLNGPKAPLNQIFKNLNPVIELSWFETDSNSYISQLFLRWLEQDSRTTFDGDSLVLEDLLERDHYTVVRNLTIKLSEEDIALLRFLGKSVARTSTYRTSAC